MLAQSGDASGLDLLVLYSRVVLQVSLRLAADFRTTLRTSVRHSEAQRHSKGVDPMEPVLLKVITRPMLHRLVAFVGFPHGTLFPSVRLLFLFPYSLCSSLTLCSCQIVKCQTTRVSWTGG